MLILVPMLRQDTTWLIWKPLDCPDGRPLLANQLHPYLCCSTGVHNFCPHIHEALNHSRLRNLTWNQAAAAKGFLAFAAYALLADRMDVQLLHEAGCTQIEKAMAAADQALLLPNPDTSCFAAVWAVQPGWGMAKEAVG